MALAQVVYTISTDADFAARMRSDPESALQERGWRLSKEELSLILTTITNYGSKKIEDLLVALRWF